MYVLIPFRWELIGFKLLNADDDIDFCFLWFFVSGAGTGFRVGLIIFSSFYAFLLRILFLLFKL